MKCGMATCILIKYISGWIDFHIDFLGRARVCVEIKRLLMMVLGRAKMPGEELALFFLHLGKVSVWEPGREATWLGRFTLLWEGRCLNTHAHTHTPLERTAPPQWHPGALEESLSLDTPVTWSWRELGNFQDVLEAHVHLATWSGRWTHLKQLHLFQMYLSLTHSHCHFCFSG